MCVYILFIGFITKCSWENQLQQPLNYMLNWLRHRLASHLYRRQTGPSVHERFSHNLMLMFVTVAVAYFFFVRLPFSILANLLSSGFYQIQKVFTTRYFIFVKHKPVHTLKNSNVSLLSILFVLFHVVSCLDAFFYSSSFAFAPSFNVNIHFVSFLLLYACLIQLRNDLSTFIHSLMTISMISNKQTYALYPNHLNASCLAVVYACSNNIA